MIVIRILFSPLRLLVWVYCRIANLRREKTLLIHQVPDRFSHIRPTGWLARFLPRPDVNFVEYLALLDIFAKSGLQTIILKIPDIETSWAETEAVGARLDALASAGKRLVAISEGGNLKTLFLMAAASERYTAFDASFLSVFPSAEPVFLKHALARFGIRVESYTAGKYKSAAEMFTRDSMSLPARENLESVLTDMRREIISRFERAGAARTASFLKENVLVRSSDLRSTGFIRDEIAALFPFEQLAGVSTAKLTPHVFTKDTMIAEVPGPLTEAQSEAQENLKRLEKNLTTDEAVASRFYRRRFKSVRLRKLPSVAFLSFEGSITMGRPGDEPQTMGINA
ncbi:MAG: hypothetical protein HY042_10565, partial [Spirochaetia bacterium]|nr:hypothetical protein [Spirochaetia bacterium]